MSDAVIYVALLDEGTPVWRPVSAERQGNDTYRITSPKEDPDEVWQFGNGSLVRIERRTLGGEQCLCAVEEVGA